MSRKTFNTQHSTSNAELAASREPQSVGGSTLNVQCSMFPQLPKENSLLRQWTGPLSADLTLHPGDFGLGKVPARIKPDATTRVT